MKSNSGNIVETKTGLVGRTYNHKQSVNGKIPVYLEQTKGKMDWGDTAMLCDPLTLKVKGFID